jgi:predicted Zn-dependent peptidase
MKYRFFLVSFLSFTVLFSSLIQTPVHALSVISESRQSETSPTNDLLDAKIHTLDNGLKIYMTVYKNAPRIQTYIAVKAGSKNDPSDATGLAHYLEHLLFKGTTRFGTINYEKEAPLLKQIEEKFEEYRQTKDTLARKAIYSTIDSLSYEASKYAIPNEYDKMVGSIGAKGTNAYTWVEQTVYVNDIPSNQLENWLKLERERFGTAIMRLFHTELEVVYEEKNRSLDNDNRKIWHTLYKGLFEDHTYGTQTTIGTIEHLKNPSLTKVIDYFQTYYVPNNMAICLSGDFDPEEAVQLIDKYFGDMTPKAIPEFDPPAAKPLNEPKRYDIYGPDAEDMVIGFRFEGANSEEADYITLIDKILSNGSVGLIDLNLNQQQKVLGASSFTVPMKDFSAHVLSAQPKKGQTLDKVKQLLLSQLDSLKAGRFPDWLLEASLNNMKLDLINTYESNRQRASAFVQAYVWDMPWALKT